MQADLPSFRFDPEKAIEAVLYIATRIPVDKRAVLRVLYLADKQHLRTYARFIAGDFYHALDFGPTPMRTYGLIELQISFEGVKGGASTVLREQGCNGSRRLEALRDPDLDVFSDSDLECLDAAIDKVLAQPDSDPLRALREEIYDRAWLNARAERHDGRMSIQHILD
ncbi:Panacea domain-containing protein [Thioalkalivibrio thiocyanodenitrificans]|uniref:Panacea domain-containing protein n=1 Tax=Thioalkalivibrio thiocyanodenitrificans TaxID=243063 RepID=UPI0003758B75|nr:Panacea domain-containing protein [Thioalkalivibrio thiocyanodenitrificans]